MSPSQPSTATPQATTDPALAQQKFDLALSLLLNLWPSLTIAVREGWGGPESSSKREWLAGALSDLFLTSPRTEQEDVEDMLLQVMGDEFDLLVEDGSEIVVARDIMKYRALCGNGEFGEVDRLYEMWRQNRNGAVSAGGNIRRSEVEGEDSEDDSGDDEDEDEDGDEDMGDVDMEGTEDAGPSRERHEPEVDEDGFTKVVGKKRR